MTALVELRDVSRLLLMETCGNQVLRNLSLKIRTGEFLGSPDQTAQEIQPFSTLFPV